jgi:hypothetical protein
MGFLAAGMFVLCLSLTWDDGVLIAFAREGARTALQTSCRAAAALSVLLPPSETSARDYALALAVPALVAGVTLLLFFTPRPSPFPLFHATSHP